MKLLSEFICQNCGAKSPAYLGKCPQCGVWGSYVETPKPDAQPNLKTKEKARLVNFSQISFAKLERISTGILEVDRVLGGGIVPSSVILLAGEPGIGKSTLLTQISQNLAQKGLKVIYVTGEESEEQVYLRLDRLFKEPTNSILLAAETDVEKIVNAVKVEKPEVVLIDSVQTMSLANLTGTPGSIGQVRESARILHSAAKQDKFGLILVGHITKEGAIAGPKVLEHLVDVVLEFSGDAAHNFRILKTTKNRFGSISEVGIFEMTNMGLTEVENPSKYFVKAYNPSQSGSVIFPTLTGSRIVLCEIQALLVPGTFAQPRRVVNGLDYLRLAQILAVVAKIAKIPLNSFDIFVNVAGGLKITEPAADLPTTLAILSIAKNIPIKVAAAAEVGLLGELRDVGQIERRRAEAAKFGFRKFLGPELGDINQALAAAFKKA